MRWLDWFTHVCACWKHTVPGVRLKLHALAREAVRGEISPFSSVSVPPSLRLFSRSDQRHRPPALPCSLVYFLSFSFSLLHPSSTLALRLSFSLDACLNLFFAGAMVHAEIERTECARAEWRDGASDVVCGAK